MKRIMTLVLFVAGGSLVFAQDEGKKGGQAEPAPGTVKPSVEELARGIRLGTPPPFPPDPENERLVMIVDRWAAGEMRGPTRSPLRDFGAYLHPDFRLTTHDGRTLSKKAYLDELTRGDLKSRKIVKYGIDITRSLGGRVAIVTGQATIQGERLDAEKRPQFFSADILFTDVFIDVSDEPGVHGERRRWQCLSSSHTLTKSPTEYDLTKPSGRARTARPRPRNSLV
jgi:hypothetical protein